MGVSYALDFLLLTAELERVATRAAENLCTGHQAEVLLPPTAILLVLSACTFPLPQPAGLAAVVNVAGAVAFTANSVNACIVCTRQARLRERSSLPKKGGISSQQCLAKQTLDNSPATSLTSWRERACVLGTFSRQQKKQQTKPMRDTGAVMWTDEAHCYN